MVRRARVSSQLSKVAFAEAAGTTRAAVDEYEKGLRMPRVDSLVTLLEPAGLYLMVEDRGAKAATEAGRTLASFVSAIDPGEPEWAWRTLISDFCANEFAPALGPERTALVAQEPARTSSPQWDSFVGALAEHLSFHAQIDQPSWVFGARRGAVDQWWWPVHGTLPSMRSASLALSPAAFRRRRIAVDGRELPVIAP